MLINIRRPAKEDIPFLGWVMFTAARSHLEKCPWSVIFGESEAGTRRSSRTRLPNPANSLVPRL